MEALKEIGCKIVAIFQIEARPGSAVLLVQQLAGFWKTDLLERVSAHKLGLKERLL